MTRPGTPSYADGETVVRLGQTLCRSADKRDFFAPSDWHALDERDADLGGTNPVPLDVAAPRGTKALLLALGKDGKAYLLDRDNLGGIGGQLSAATVAARSIITAPTAYPIDDGVLVAFHADWSQCPAADRASGLVVLKVRAEPQPDITTAWCGPVRGPGAPIATTTDGHANPIVWMLGAGGDNRLHGFRGDIGEPLFTGRALSGLRRSASPIWVFRTSDVPDYDSARSSASIAGMPPDAGGAIKHGERLDQRLSARGLPACRPRGDASRRDEHVPEHLLGNPLRLFGQQSDTAGGLPPRGWHRERDLAGPGRHQQSERKARPGNRAEHVPDELREHPDPCRQRSARDVERALPDVERLYQPDQPGAPQRRQPQRQTGAGIGADFPWPETAMPAPAIGCFEHARVESERQEHAPHRFANEGMVVAQPGHARPAGYANFGKPPAGARKNSSVLGPKHQVARCASGAASTD